MPNQSRSITDEWFNKDFAKQWDETAFEGNHARTKHLDIMLSIILKEYQAANTILDLGIGSGQFEATIFDQRPNANIVGVDYSPAMLELAEIRLRSFLEQCVLIQHDFTNLEKLVLPRKKYQIAVSVQALHHISHQKKLEVFKYLYQILEEKGIFLLSDRITINTTHLSHLYTALWEYLEENSKMKSGWSGKYYVHERLPQKADYPATLEELLTFLHEAGFQAACLHLQMDRALIAGIKLPKPLV
ncbi:class I SAM-dependent methyltransferase [Scytonema sp. NUACC26]|uniref:class I SAM-dependent methyltransferase n=1 Tax=Scytonema sp. NUACC26 TaxID=3140176 RepID=UPI0034DC87BB